MEQIVDHDISYFLGLCVARGEMNSEQMLIRFRYTSDTIRVPPGSDSDFSRKSREYVIDVVQLEKSLASFFQTDITASKTDSTYTLTVPMREGSFARKTMVGILGDRNFSYRKSRIPRAILAASLDIKRTFIQGIADACSCPTYSDRDQAGRCRICIDIPFDNWLLPLEICRVLQEDLDVKVANILWGHPNVRAPNELNSRSWAKEHRIRIFAPEFEKVGFRFEFKTELLEEFCKWNERKPKPKKFCCPVSTRENEKPDHPGEQDTRLPENQRRHFDNYREICASLGCAQRARA